MAKIIKDSNGKVLLGNSGAYEVTAAIDSNITPANIRKDVSILGVNGTFEGDTDGIDGVLSAESKTVPASASTTTNIVYNKKCGIVDENNKLWDTLQWHQRWVDNGYSADGLSKPIGIWMIVWGKLTIYLWPISDPVGYSDVTGTIEPTTDGFQHFCYNVNTLATATTNDRTVWPANQSGMIAHGTAGKYNSATWRCVNNGEGIDLFCLNTGETFTYPSRDVGSASSFTKDNNEDYMESYYQQNEFLRALFAICSGLTTNEEDGTTTTVEILNAGGQQAAIGEDFYFWINGTNTGLLAKYNLNSRPSVTSNPSSGVVTQTIADAIYAAQKANGVNMNDTGVNSSTKPTKVTGMKGAEAIAVDGYWYIKTPFISNQSSSTFDTVKNMADSPAIYLCKNKGVSLLPDKQLFAYWLNKDTHITSTVNLLRDTEGLTTDVPEVLSSNIWSAFRYSAAYIWLVSNSSGHLDTNYSYNRHKLLPCPLSSTVFTQAQDGD